MRKCYIYLLFVSVFILILPVVSAEEIKCGILNLASCLPLKIFEFLSSLLNLPIIPLLAFIKKLMSEPVNLSLFSSLWAIIIYIISMFYGILLMYSGFNFIISGHNVAKRENAKTWLRNILIMVVLVQASFFIYSLVLELSSLLTVGVLNLVDESIYYLVSDNQTNLGLQILFSSFYVLTLMLTSIVLSVRYLIVAIGVVFVPIGIFFYFTSPLSSYGRVILNFLGICIFITFFDAIILLECSKLLEISLYQNFQIMVMISAFTLINILMLYFMFFGIIKSAFSTVVKTKSVAGQVAQLVG